MKGGGLTARYVWDQRGVERRGREQQREAEGKRDYRLNHGDVTLHSTSLY